MNHQLYTTSPLTVSVDRTHEQLYHISSVRDRTVAPYILLSPGYRIHSSGYRDNFFLAQILLYEKHCLSASVRYTNA